MDFNQQLKSACRSFEDRESFFKSKSCNTARNKATQPVLRSLGGPTAVEQCPFQLIPVDGMARGKHVNSRRVLFCRRDKMSLSGDLDLIQHLKDSEDDRLHEIFETSPFEEESSSVELEGERPNNLSNTQTSKNNNTCNKSSIDYYSIFTESLTRKIWKEGINAYKYKPKKEKQLRKPFLNNRSSKTQHQIE